MRFCSGIIGLWMLMYGGTLATLEDLTSNFQAESVETEAVVGSDAFEDDGGGTSTTPASEQIAIEASPPVTSTESHLINMVDYDQLQHQPLFSEQYQLLRLAAIKQDILNRLGMTVIPDVSKFNTTIQEKRQVLRLYRKSLEELHGKRSSLISTDDDIFYANQFNSYTENGDRPPTLSSIDWSTMDNLRIYFAVDIPEPTDPRKETVVKSAMLKMFKKRVKSENLMAVDAIDASVRINVYQIVQTRTLGAAGSQQQGQQGQQGQQQQQPRLQRRSVDSKLVSLRKASWEEFDISNAVQDWIRDPSSNIGLEIVCDSRYRMENLLEFNVWSPATRDNAYQTSLLPTLNILTHEKRILGRQKRDAIENRRQVCMFTIEVGIEEERHLDCGVSETRCCRYPVFNVSFRELQMDSWILEPKTYQIYDCRGSCSPNFNIAHNWAKIKSSLWEADRLSPNSVFALHCTATKFGPLSIAHYNRDGQLVVQILDNSIAEECMCA